MTEHNSYLHLSFSFGTYETEEENDRDGDKDAVFVTDGDSDLGQVCVYKLFTQSSSYVGCNSKNETEKVLIFSSCR